MHVNAMAVLVLGRLTYSRALDAALEAAAAPCRAAAADGEAERGGTLKIEEGA